jgi:radical SAM protein with 4Fe4S-binding SPASM domain
MVLELTNICNNNCIHCVRDMNLPHLKEQGFIKKELVKQLMDDLADKNMRFYDLNLFWIGEPLLHPDFAEIYEYVLNVNKKSKIFNTINIHTNAYFMSDKISKIFFQYSDVPQTLHFTIDATTSETYKKVKNFDGFEKVVNNAKRFIANKKGKFPRIVMQFIVEEQNYKEASSFIKFWSDEFTKNKLHFSKVAYYVPGYVDNFIFLRQLDCVRGGQECQKKANKLYKKIILENKIPNADYTNKESIFDSNGFDGFPENRNNGMKDDFENTEICSGFWKTPTISWTGEVTVCTRDNGLDLKVGNLNEQKFSEIWWENDNIKQKRLAMIKKDFSLIPLCKDCLIPKSSNYTSLTTNQLKLYQNER